MYAFLHEILQDQFRDPRFSMYNLCHVLYLVFLFAGITAVVLLFRNKSETIKKRIVSWSINLAFILYMADLFIMPFSQGDIDIDKLPFHFCTLMCILCFMSRHNSFLGKFKAAVTLVGTVGALIYILCPSSVADGQVSFFSYRILQTLTFHGLMIGYGIYALIFGDIRLQWKECYKDAIVIGMTIIWGIIGNNLYNGVAGRVFNWGSVSTDPLGIIPESLAPFILPFVIFAIFFLSNLCIYLLYYGVKRLTAKQKA